MLKFYPGVTDYDFDIIKVIIDNDVINRTDDFPNLIQCLIYVLDETSKTLTDEANGMKSIYRDMMINKILEKE